MTLHHGDELPDDEAFYQLRDSRGRMSIAGFGSLLSIRSAKSTFPDLQNFRALQVEGFRRVFAHTAPIFFERGIARLETMEISSLSCEEAPGCSIVVTVFDIPCTPDMIAAVLDREHEFRFLAVRPVSLPGALLCSADTAPVLNGGTAASPDQEALAIICGRWTDEEYKARRCPPDEFKRRFLDHGVDRVWRDDVLPCRAYLRHCVLAAQHVGPKAGDSFLDSSFLADRTTSIRQYLQLHPDIMLEQPPPHLATRYGG
mmetsp:Transcript_19560/g.59172  ORF Transcript_19560/g.59172 Transcript_19560/m.59172 type:complete len:258 (+) Transcript_19560:232-1005(+)